MTSANFFEILVFLILYTHNTCVHVLKAKGYVSHNILIILGSDPVERVSPALSNRLVNNGFTGSLV